MLKPKWPSGKCLTFVKGELVVRMCNRKSRGVKNITTPHQIHDASTKMPSIILYFIYKQS